MFHVEQARRPARAAALWRQEARLVRRAGTPLGRGRVRLLPEREPRRCRGADWDRLRGGEHAPSPLHDRPPPGPTAPEPAFAAATATRGTAASTWRRVSCWRSSDLALSRRSRAGARTRRDRRPPGRATHLETRTKTDRTTVPACLGRFDARLLAPVRQRSHAAQVTWLRSVLAGSSCAFRTKPGEPRPGTLKQFGVGLQSRERGRRRSRSRA